MPTVPSSSCSLWGKKAHCVTDKLKSKVSPSVFSGRTPLWWGTAVGELSHGSTLQIHICNPAVRTQWLLGFQHRHSSQKPFKSIITNYLLSIIDQIRVVVFSWLCIFIYQCCNSLWPLYQPDFFYLVLFFSLSLCALPPLSSSLLNPTDSPLASGSVPEFLATVALCIQRLVLSFFPFLFWMNLRCL